jgi:hypothetical protein
LKCLSCCKALNIQKVAKMAMMVTPEALPTPHANSLAAPENAALVPTRHVNGNFPMILTAR